MSKRIWIFFAGLILIIGLLVGNRIYENNKKDAANLNRPRGTNTRVFGVIAKGTEFSDFLSLNGSIEANEIVDIRSEIPGIVEKLNFTEGTYVNKGDLLLKINDSELRAQLSQAQTRSALASENERRAKLLLEKEAISQEEYDIVSADYRTAKAQIELIEAQLRKTTVVAPFSGKVGLRHISPGSYITSSDIVAQLVNLNRVKVQFAIPEKYSSMVKEGLMIKFAVDGVNREFVAEIYAIEPLIDPASRTLTVRAITDNVDNLLLPGAFANISFPLETLNDALLIPAEAIIPIQNGKMVFLKKNGEAMEVIVESGARLDSTILITKGISIGDTVLTSGVMSLRNGSPVEVELR